MEWGNPNTVYVRTPAQDIPFSYTNLFQQWRLYLDHFFCLLDC